MKKALALLVLVIAMTLATPGKAQTMTTVNLSAPATFCSGSVYPINCTFKATDQNGNAGQVHIYFMPGYNSYVLLPPISEGDGVVTTVNAPIIGYSQTIPPGSYFPSTLTVTFQGGEVWDGEEYVPVTGTATLSLTYTGHPAYRHGIVWTAMATLSSMQYSY
jgi:hypothetical protein